jgi:peptidoglycan/xylan/chitin deacetylase (PgdA/CDA1 family)
MKHLAKATLCGVYKYSGAMYAQETLHQFAGWPHLAVLLFHRVTDAIPEDGLTVSTRHFQAICRMLQRGFNVVTVAEIYRLLNAGEPVPRRTVAITFDDCYRDNLCAAQVLAHYRLPATFFIPTGYIGTDAVFEWDLDLPRMANLTWDDLTEMASMGFEFGSHSVTHPNFVRLPKSKAKAELVESKKQLEDHLGRPIRWFAYPFGGKAHFGAHLLPVVQDAGYEGCLSGYGGFIYPHLREPILVREPIPSFRSVLNLEVHLAGCLHWLYSARQQAGML